MDSIDFQKIVEKIYKNEATDTCLVLLDHSQAQELAKAIVSNTSLSSITLSNINCGEEGVKAIFKALTNHKSISRVVIFHTPISEEAARVFAEFILNSKTISDITLSSSKLGDKGIKLIAEALKYNKTIEAVLLENNEIGNEGAKVIAEALESNKSLKLIGLDKNHDKSELDSEGLISIAKAIGSNKKSSIYELVLDHCKIDFDAAEAMAEALKNNFILKITGHKVDSLRKYNHRNFQKLNKALSLITLPQLIAGSGEYNKLTTEDIAILKAGIAPRSKHYNEKIMNEFLKKLPILEDNTALQIQLFDLLNLPIHNALTSHLNNKDASQYNELYNLFLKQSLTEDEQQAFNAFRTHYNTIDNNDLNLRILWNKLVHYAGENLGWTEQKIHNLKTLENNIMLESSTANELKKTALFHCLFPEYRNNLSLTIEHFAEEILEGLKDSDANDPRTLDLVRNLEKAILPERIKMIIADISQEVSVIKAREGSAALERKEKSGKLKFDTDHKSGKEEIEEDLPESNNSGEVNHNFGNHEKDYNIDADLGGLTKFHADMH
ncbi:MAG: hypothetical protein K0Q51_1207 [Rickettsiaceae bacterium]|nr:hypothetical protein [Rickettsiaceae bacterium]